MEEECPKCHARGTLHTGYGLAGGGIGVYTYCDAEGCDFFDKVQDPPEEPPVGRRDTEGGR